MHLAGQAERGTDGERGYAMAALLVALSIMAVMFTVVMPVWKQTAQREKEEELVFRGKHTSTRSACSSASSRTPTRRTSTCSSSSGSCARSSRTRSPTTTSCRSRRGRACPARLSSPAASAARPDRRLPAARQTSPPRPRSRAPDASAVRPTAPVARADGGRHSGRDEQEQGSIDSPLQRTRPLQRVGLRLHSAAAGRRRRRRRIDNARSRRSARPARPAARSSRARRHPARPAGTRPDRSRTVPAPRRTEFPRPRPAFGPAARRRCPPADGGRGARRGRSADVMTSKVGRWPTARPVPVQ